jgi:hypothetical protein
MLYYISSYTSSIVAVVWVSVTKRKRFLEVVEYISKVDKKKYDTHHKKKHT